MSQTLIKVISTGLFFLALTVFAQNKAETPAIASSPVPSVAPSPSATPALPLSEDEKKSLLKEFKKAQVQERISMSHQERSALRELRVALNQKQKKWREEQKRARHKFFDDHKSGPERREYVQTYLKKKEEFESGLKTEMVTAKKNWSEKIQNLKKSQKESEAKFSESVSKGIRPGPEFWPVAH